MSNTINFNEFKQAFNGASMSDAELRQLFNQLDVNRDGEINYDEFLTGLRDKRTANSKAGKLLQNDFVRQYRQVQDNTAIAQLFRQLDTDMSNTINFSEFKQAFIGSSMSEPEMR